MSAVLHQLSVATCPLVLLTLSSSRSAPAGPVAVGAPTSIAAPVSIMATASVASPAAVQNTLTLISGDNVTVNGSGTTGIYQGQAINNSVSNYNTNANLSTVSVSNGSTFTLQNSGSLSNTSDLGSGIFSEGTTTISGGTISGGNGILNSGTLRVSNGGSIAGNSAIFSSGASSITVSGGTITGKNVGLYAFSGSVAVSGGTIIGSGEASIYGTSTNLTVTGGTLPNGLYLVDGKTVITGGTISSGITEVAENQTTSSPARVYIAGGNISGELVASNGGSSSNGSTIDLFGSFTATDDSGQPISSPITNTDGLIKGTLLDGRAISVPYSAFGGTIEFNVGTPPVSPVTITDVRLGIPTLGTDAADNKILTQGVYITGSGTGAVSGQFYLDGQPAQSISQANVDLSFGNWVKLGDFQSVLTGQHSLDFLVDDNNVVTAVAKQFSLRAQRSTSTPSISRKSSLEDIYLTKFIPHIHRFAPSNSAYIQPWRSNNEFLARIYDFFSPFDGLCEGFTQAARGLFNGQVTFPQSSPYKIDRTAYGMIKDEFDAGNKWNAEHDYMRVKPALMFPPDPVLYRATLESEAQKIIASIKSSGPCVIDLDPLQAPGAKEDRHSVLGIGEFSSANVYDDLTQQTIQSMHIFPIYDPNSSPLDQNVDKRSVGSFDYGNIVPQYRLRFIPSDMNYQFIMWEDNTFPGILQ